MKKVLKATIVVLAMMTMLSIPAGALAGVGDDQLGGSHSGSGTSGWEKFGSDWYYYDAGTQAYYEDGWAKIGGKWYYFDAEGAMWTGFLTEDYYIYFLGLDGAMRTGWFKVGGEWYYANASGVVLQTSWIYSGGKWYYVKDDGAMAYSQWRKIGGVWYFFRSTGAMATGTVTIDGQPHLFASSGKWLGAVYG